MSIPRWAMCCATTLLLLTKVCAGTSVAAHDCTTPQQMTRFKVTLPNTARAIRSGKPLVIVAIGSSSTEGIGASDPAHTYPAVLADELHRSWPQVTLTVFNKGVGGQIASEMLARFERDVLVYHPQLVIWQTGSNHTLRIDSIEGYADTIRQGISRLKAASADVVLMDPQFAPRILARPMHVMVVDSISSVGSDMKVAVFRRFAVMQHWVSNGQYKSEDIISSDGLHMNDVSYSCIARLLAGSVVAATEPGTEGLRPHQAAKNTSR
jgi:acyl-CoA thioesterase-1